MSHSLLFGAAAFLLFFCFLKFYFVGFDNYSAVHFIIQFLILKPIPLSFNRKMDSSEFFFLFTIFPNMQSCKPLFLFAQNWFGIDSTRFSSSL